MVLNHGTTLESSVKFVINPSKIKIYNYIKKYIHCTVVENVRATILMLEQSTGKHVLNILV